MIHPFVRPCRVWGWLALGLWAIGSTLAAPVSLPPGFVRETLADAEIPEPMDLAFAPDGAAWVSARSGGIWRIDTVDRSRHRVGTIPTDTKGDRGLHGLAFHPDFPNPAHLFVFSHALKRPGGKYRSRVSRWTVQGSGGAARLDPGSEKVLLEYDGNERGQHVGGGLLAHPTERVLYVTTGDNNVIWELKDYCNDPKNQAQSWSDLRGKVLRIGFDGTVPQDNPLVGVAGARPEVYTRGHRQPWELNLDPPTGLLLLAENGGDETDDYEEVNRVAPGQNYGWPRVFGEGWETAGRTNRIQGFTPPWFSYRRNTGGSCTGALIYRAPKVGGGFPTNYIGGLFYSDYNRKSVRFAPLDAATGRPGTSQAFAQNLPGGPVSLRLGPDGALYLVEYGGWFQATALDAVSRIVWRP